jgi:26S proteasome regulatory subunit T6
MATNRIDILDDALLRPGRIDRKIEFPPPNDAARADILRIHARRMNMSRDIDLLKIAEKMAGASGAECKVCVCVGGGGGGGRISTGRTLLCRSMVSRAGCLSLTDLC